MRRFIKILTLSLLFSQILTPANASISPINLENPRVVPVFGRIQIQGVTVDAVWSGYLYSPRIIFTAAHSNYTFDNNGNRILSGMAVDTVGKPNSNAFDKTGRVKVIKTFVGDYKQSLAGDVNDFIVYVLERDLVPISKGNLLTAEIEKELVAVQSEVKIHGYGEYQDRCPGQPSPCKPLTDPKMRVSEFPRSPTGIMKLVAPSYFPWMSPHTITSLANETLVSENFGCSGDSGGPVTIVYKGTPYYLGSALNSSNTRSCGAGRVDDPTKAYAYFSPVYKHLDLIKAAEDFIEANPATTSKTTITCSKSKSVKKISGANPKCPKGFKKT